jgi:hypothetical protein
VEPLPTEDEFEAARVKFQTARDAFMKTKPLVKQAQLQASERAARRTAEKERRDKVPSPMLDSPPPVVRPTAMHGRCDNVLSPMLVSPASRVRLFFHKQTAFYLENERGRLIARLPHLRGGVIAALSF